MADPVPPVEGAGFNDLVGLVEEQVAEGRATITLVAGERHLNPAGTVHGGAIATLIDVAMGRAMASLIADDERPVTIEMKVNFLEAGGPGDIVATADVSRRGRRFTVVHAEVTQRESGRDRRRGDRDLHERLRRDPPATGPGRRVPDGSRPRPAAIRPRRSRTEPSRSTSWRVRRIASRGETNTSLHERCAAASRASRRARMPFESMNLSPLRSTATTGAPPIAAASTATTSSASATSRSPIRRTTVGAPSRRCVSTAKRDDSMTRSTRRSRRSGTTRGSATRPSSPPRRAPLTPRPARGQENTRARGSPTRGSDPPIGAVPARPRGSGVGVEGPQEAQPKPRV